MTFRPRIATHTEHEGGELLSLSSTPDQIGAMVSAEQQEPQLEARALEQSNEPHPTISQDETSAKSRSPSPASLSASQHSRRTRSGGVRKPLPTKGDAAATATASVKKPTPKKATPRKTKWDAENILVDPKSPLAEANLRVCRQEKQSHHPSPYSLVVLSNP